ncbi:MAG: porphobilinogen synthase [Phycisphaerales bacterium]|nr:porphobilinogen synthase [Phycisphaerales bacterium]
MQFPTTRTRRLRLSPAIRRVVGETDLTPRRFIQPVFVVENPAAAGPLDAMPGQRRWTVDELVEPCRRAADAGVGGVLLFGIPNRKDAMASAAYAADGVVQRAVAIIKRELPDLLLITDVCLCAYMDHGHCGVLRDGNVDNDASLELLARTAVSHARAGADIAAPSDMMDGRVAAIRAALDRDGFTHTAILSYAVKYASAFYGPFREAAESAPQSGDRKGYQMDPANAREAVKLARMAEQEGADMLMVKPALPYLDVIRRVRDATTLPLAAYHVSGEYAMIEAAAANGWIDRDRVIHESLTAIRRAGADIIITYYATEAAERLIS